MNYYECTGGERVNQTQINRRLSKEKKDCTIKYVCECCEKNQTNDCDHTISQRRCKELHKTELIWIEGNWSWSCRSCHTDWEEYKSGNFQHHKNFKKRMLFVAMYDLEGFQKRINSMDEGDAKTRMQELSDSIRNEL